MPQIGDLRMIRFARTWLNRRHMSLLVSCGVLITVVFVSACAGVDDNGTTFETLATMEARQAPAAPPVDPGGSTDPAAMIAAGRDIYNASGCIGCHTLDGAASVGPTWAGLWMSDITLSDGSTVVADEQYILTAIVDPGAQVHEGFTNIMPSYEGQLNDDQINAVIEFIKSLE